MSSDQNEDQSDINEAQEEALTLAEGPGQVLDPLAGPAGSRGTQREVVSEYDEEDARLLPPEDGLNPSIPEDENLRISVPLNLEEELDDDQIRRNLDE